MMLTPTMANGIFVLSFIRVVSMTGLPWVRTAPGWVAGDCDCVRRNKLLSADFGSEEFDMMASGLMRGFVQPRPHGAKPQGRRQPVSIGNDEPIKLGRARESVEKNRNVAKHLVEQVNALEVGVPFGDRVMRDRVLDFLDKCTAPLDLERGTLQEVGRRQGNRDRHHSRFPMTCSIAVRSLGVSNGLATRLFRRSAWPF